MFTVMTEALDLPASADPDPDGPRWRAPASTAPTKTSEPACTPCPKTSQSAQPDRHQILGSAQQCLAMPGP